MKQVKIYDSDHPMLLNNSGDPARGEWVTKKMEGKRKGKRQ